MEKLSGNNSAPSSSDPISELQRLLGPVVFLGWPRGSKGTMRKWRHLSIADMTRSYLAKLKHGNIGVALGKKSGNLVALDVDDDNLVAPFLALNPFLNNTLQTHGARGRVFWLRMGGDYPDKTVKLKNDSGADCGEWRGGKNSQSIIHGIHPNGNPYQVVNKVKPFVVDFTDIVWPTDISNPPRLQTHFPLAAVTATEEAEDTEDTNESEEVGAWLFAVNSIGDALRVSTPTAPHQNYRLALILARAVKALEAQTGKRFTPAQHRNIHNQWLARAAQFLRAGQTEEDYFMEYLNAYQLAKYPLGSVAIAKAISAAQKRPFPAGALKWADNPDVRLLAAICRELQAIHGAEPFYLSARMVQKVFKHENHAIGAKWLRSFCVMQVLEEVEKGKGLRASRYRFISANS